MALTKISTGGVKDDAASQAKIADEAVDEARLQISNAGTNGQFLQKQSGNTGGLTWADAASEGTDIKSTGESGTAKFLRVDGDGTCSWQVPPDNNTVYTHPNHSGEVESTGDGATVIASNVVDEDNLKISNAGTNGQFLQKQSGNTGGLTWETISASPSVTANADGAIGAGDAVEMQTNGTVKKIAATVVVNNPPVKQINSTQDSNQTTIGNAVSIAYWPDESAFVMLYKPDSNDSLYAQAGKVTSTGAITWGNSRSGNLESSNNNDAVIKHASGDIFIVMYRDSSNSVRVKPLTVTRSSDTSYSYSTANSTVLFSTGSEMSIAKVDTAGNYFLVVSKDYANSNRPSARMFYRNGTSFTAGTAQFGSSCYGGSGIQGNKPYVFYDSTSGKAVVYADAGGSGQTVYYCVATPSYSTSNPTMSWGTRANVKGTDNNNIKAERKIGYHDTVQNKIVFMCAEENVSGTQPSILCGTLSGTTITWGALVRIGTSGNNASRLSSAYDSTNGVGLIHFRDSDSNNGENFVGGITVNSSNVVTVTNLLEISDDGYMNRHGATFDTTNGLVLISFRTGSNGRAGVQGINLASTTTTAEKLLGFNQSAVSDGNAATIDLVGATNEHQSSLTVGSKYYVQKNGTIATTADTPSVVAGTAIAATKLVVKG